MRTRLTYLDSITLDLEVTDVTWSAPGARQFGTADFNIPRALPSFAYATLGSYLRSDGKGGSLVEIETPVLGLWRGISSDPVWSKAGCAVHAMHITFLMQQRIVSRSRLFVGLTAGAIFSAAVQDALAGIGGQILRPGTFLEAGPAIPRYEFRGQTLAQVGLDLYQMTGQEWLLADDGSLSWVPPRGTLYGTLLCDDGDIADVVKPVAGSEGADEVIGRDAVGREFIARSGSTSLLARQQLVSVGSSSVGAAGLAAMQALAAASGTPATYTARLKRYSGAGDTVTAWEVAIKSINPSAWWRMDELAGTTLADSSGNANTATTTGSPTLGATGLIVSSSDTAITFNGTTQYASAADATTLDVGNFFGLECIIQRSAVGVAGTIIDKGAGAYRLSINASNQVVFEVPGGTVLATSSVTIADLAPHHIVAVKLLSITIAIYVDGRDVTTPGVDTSAADNASSLWIGATGGASSFFAGTIDEVAIYKGSTATVALQSAVAAHYAAMVRANHHQRVREGDYLRVFSPYTAPGGETPLTRVMSRSAADNDPLLTVELQYVDPIDAQTSMRLIGDLGTMAPPPSVVPSQNDQAQIIAILKDDLAKAQVQLNALQTKVG